jgi:glycosyltransferase involved in cell wall biosynthesis
LQTARLHDTWVLTRSSSRAAIESALRDRSAHPVHFTYLDLPKWLRLWKKLPLGVQVYYYLWQLFAYLPAKRLHRAIHFDFVHHVTFCTYWQPSLLAFLSSRFVWGPVGGGESAPPSFFSSFSLRGRMYELLRRFVQRMAELDPLLRATARRASIAIATTNDTALRLNRLGCKNIQIFSQVGITREVCEALVCSKRTNHVKFRVCSAGRLSHLKGLNLALRAVAKLRERTPEMEYWIFGAGPERSRLTRLARELGIEQHVTFWPHTCRWQLLDQLTDCDVLLHTGLHESGGLICTEAMAAGCPVVCLDLGGLALQVTGETGIKIPADSPEQAIEDLAAALQSLAENPIKRRDLSRGARARVECSFRWDRKVEAFWKLCE